MSTTPDETPAPAVWGDADYPSLPVASAPVQAYQPQLPVQQVVPRNAVLYVIASIFFPGLGTGLNGKWGKAAAFFFSQFVCIPLILVFGLGLIGLFGIRIWACIDAYNETQAWNLAHGFTT